MGPWRGTRRGAAGGTPKSLGQEGPPESLSQAGGEDTPQLRLRRKAGGAPPDAFGRGEALSRSWCENKESGLCFLKDQADSSVGNARGEAGTAGGQRDDKRWKCQASYWETQWTGLGDKACGWRSESKPSDFEDPHSEDPGSTQRAERLFNN